MREEWGMCNVFSALFFLTETCSYFISFIQMAEATKIKTMVQQIIQKEYSSNNITEMK